MPRAKAVAAKRSEPLLEAEKRCTYAGCKRPDRSSKFYQILDEGKASGGHDWSALVGSVLCDTCYRRFKASGSLDRRLRSPLTEAERVCTYAGCTRPSDSSQYHYIEEGRRAGGRDWTPLIGSVLCQACYDRFKNSGSLEKPPSERLAAEEKRCSSPWCTRPRESCHFYLIERGTRAGGQDWGPLVGSVLCNVCYCRYKDWGAMDKGKGAPEGGQQRCGYAQCKDPEGGAPYRLVGGGTRAGRRDWGPLAGKVLCNACFSRYRDQGTTAGGVRGMATELGDGRVGGSQGEGGGGEGASALKRRRL